MGLEQLCQQISATARAKGNAQVKEAEEQAERTLGQARADGQKVVAAARAEGEAFGAAEEAERTNAAKLEEQKMLSDAREEAVRRGIEAVRARYLSQGRRPGYAKNLRRWAEMAVQELDSRDYVLRARSEDYRLLHEAGFKVAREPLECAGGVRAEAHSGRIMVDYTLESLFDSKREEIGRQVHARLFSDEGAHGSEASSRPARRASAPAKRTNGGGARAKKGSAKRAGSKKAKRGRR